jgi:hypothetical protein
MAETAKTAPPADAVRLWVHDPAQGRYVSLDVSGCQSWGPVQRGEDFSSFEGYFLVSVDETLYRHPNGHWTIVSTSFHNEANIDMGTSATRMSDEGAVNWLLENCFAPPDDMAPISRKFEFETGDPPHAKSEPTRPRWDQATGELRFDGEVVRSVGPKASNLRRVFECFEIDGWPARLDSPFPDDEAGKQKLRETVRSLNQRLRRIKFASDGNGQGITWCINAAKAERDAEIPW